MLRTEITIRGIDGDFSGYLASPKGGRGPGIIVIQEIFGVNAFVREVADSFASRGYFALAPDLFWRVERGIQLTDQRQEDWDRAFELFNQFDIERGVNDVAASIAALRATSGCSEKVGAIGYCLGGLLAYLTACRTTVDGAVGYYGVSIDKHLAEAEQIKAPLMLHIADDDEFSSPEATQTVTEALAANPLITILRYPGQKHAFARTGGLHYDKDAADASHFRTLEFFRSALELAANPTPD
jgi:carboxymethylenebutenolidase